MDPPLSPRPTPVGDQPVEQNTSFMEATTQTASPAMSGVELTGPITPLDRMEEENQYVLVITALIRQLNLETANVDLREMVTAYLEGVLFGTLIWQLFSQDQQEG